ncbi:MAG TPA: DUF1236 domain-containing protein [Bradyrhizobium sp.]|jgi:hypothetical protein|nr:DUF1236 domain-containing protein [Bradyrhizobium sp.]
MFNRFMITAATAALIAGTGFAHAQGTGATKEAPAKEAPAASPGTHQSAPSATPMNREGGAEHGMKSTQSEEKMQPQGTKAQQAQDMKSPAREEKSAQDNMKGEKAKSTQTEERSKSTQNEKGAASKDMKAEGREDRTGNMKAEGREERGNMKAEGREGRSETVGQAGAGSKLTTEQRTRITTVIRDQHIAPVSNVNFAVSIGTRVPRDIGFHPLPAEIVTIYPEWRGYEFFLVRNEIVVVDPRTLEIVAVLEA